jgi:hypothetical protein
MFRSLPACVIAASAALALAPAPARAGEVQELTVIAAAHDSPLEAGIGPLRLRDTGGVVVRDARGLVALSSRPDATEDPAAQKAAEVELAKLLDVPAIDWGKQMVVAVRGTPGTKLDRVHFAPPTVAGKVLTVAWKVKQRPPHAGPGSPVAVLLVERFEHEVKFVEMGR